MAPCGFLQPAEQLPRSHVPERHRVIPASGSKDLAVAREGEGVDVDTSVPQDRTTGAARTDRISRFAPVAKRGMGWAPWGSFPGLTSPTVSPPWRETRFPQFLSLFQLAAPFSDHPAKLPGATGSPKAEAHCASGSPLPDITGPRPWPAGAGGCHFVRRHLEAVREGSQPGPSRPARGAGRAGGGNVSFHCRATHRLLQRNTFRATKRLFCPNPLPPLHKCVATAAHASQTVVRADRAGNRPPRNAPPLDQPSPESLLQGGPALPPSLP
jgi:hypothetical protein